jgi:hypothetical protein
MARPRGIRIRAQVCECGRPLPPAKTTGRPRLTCSDRCRQLRKRRRRAAPWPPVAPPSYPIDPETVRRRTAEALVALLEGDQPAPAEDQLAQALLEVDWIGYHLEALERDLPPRLGGRASELGRRIREAKRALFPEIEGVA